MSVSQLSHTHDYVSEDAFDQHLAALQTQEGYEKKDALEALAKDASLIQKVRESAFWRFYFVNGGLSGRYTEYFASFDTEMKEDFWGEPVTEIDKLYLNSHHLPLAYRETVANCRERVVEHVKTLVEKEEKSLVKIASLACGTMFDVLEVEYPTQNIEFVGYDIDALSLKYAEKKAMEFRKTKPLTTHDADVMKTELPPQEYDVVVCNGFSFYLTEEKTLQELIQKVEKTLKPGGIFLMSFILPPSQWKISEKEKQTHEQIHNIFDAIVAKWTASFRTSDTILSYCSEAGFASTECIRESHDIHPLIQAKKQES